MNDTNRKPLFPEWEEAHFVGSCLPDRIKTIHRVYGRLDGQTCRDCANLIKAQYSKTYYKCRLSKLTHGPATDWRLSWPACGKHERNVTNEYSN